MPTFDRDTASIRFGCGLSPEIASPRSISEILGPLTAPDRLAGRFPIETFARFSDRLIHQRELSLAIGKAETDGQKEQLKDARNAMRQEASRETLVWMQQTVLRRAWSTAPFRERLVQFWADHFTATGKGGVMREGFLPYVESAIRPNVAGRFEDILIAAVTHPVMVQYLDQGKSAGPNSKRGRAGDLGLNENLAREVLELHTLGVSGPYTQTDVEGMARLLTGLSFDGAGKRAFRQALADEDAKSILGRTYPAQHGLKDIEAALRDLANEESTAAHIARKLAVHFVADAPTESLVGAMTDRFVSTSGDLLSVYEAMLEHRDAWQGPGNVKQPLDMVGSTLRALAIGPGSIDISNTTLARQWLYLPLQLMGFDWGKPAGPDGLAEGDGVWASPQGMATRVQWAMSVPQQLSDDLPDPREFARTALGSRLPERVAFAADAAETKWEGIGLVLISPAFQTM